MSENKVRVAAIRKKLGCRNHHMRGNFTVRDVMIRPMVFPNKKRRMYKIEARVAWNIITTVEESLCLEDALQALFNLKLRSAYNTTW